jgi:hypothetical protein
VTLYMVLPGASLGIESGGLSSTAGPGSCRGQGHCPNVLSIRVTMSSTDLNRLSDSFRLASWAGFCYAHS